VWFDEPFSLSLFFSLVLLFSRPVPQVLFLFSGRETHSTTGYSSLFPSFIQQSTHGRLLVFLFAYILSSLMRGTNKRAYEHTQADISFFVCTPMQ